MATASPVNVANTIGKCQLCGSMRQTSPVEYNRNIGMLFLRQTRKVNARMCKTCVRKNFWDFQVKNLLLGPWGIISLVITPIYLITNTVSYASALKELKGAVE